MSPSRPSCSSDRIARQVHFDIAKPSLRQMGFDGCQRVSAFISARAENPFTRRDAAKCFATRAGVPPTKPSMFAVGLRFEAFVCLLPWQDRDPVLHTVLLFASSLPVFDAVFLSSAFRPHPRGSGWVICRSY